MICIIKSGCPNAQNRKYGIDPQEDWLCERTINWDILGEDEEENYGTLTHNNTGDTERIKTEEGCYERFYENIYGVLRKDEPLLITPEQAWNVIKVIEWVREFPVTIKAATGS